MLSQQQQKQYQPKNSLNIAPPMLQQDHVNGRTKSSFLSPHQNISLEGCMLNSNIGSGSSLFLPQLQNHLSNYATVPSQQQPLVGTCSIHRSISRYQREVHMNFHRESPNSLQQQKQQCQLQNSSSASPLPQQDLANGLTNSTFLSQRQKLGIEGCMPNSSIDSGLSLLLPQQQNGYVPFQQQPLEGEPLNSNHKNSIVSYFQEKQQETSKDYDGLGTTSRSDSNKRSSTKYGKVVSLPLGTWDPEFSQRLLDLDLDAWQHLPDMDLPDLDPELWQHLLGEIKFHGESETKKKKKTRKMQLLL